MTDAINKWLIENISLLAVWLVLLVIAVQHEKRRLDRRIDAIIALLKQRGIDIMRDDFD